MLTNENKTISYLVVTILICISGNQAFNFHGHPRTVLVIVAVLFSVLMYRYKLFDFSGRFCLAFGGFLGILVVQSFCFSFFPTVTIAGFLTRLFIAYAACRLVKDFTRTYINILFWIGVVSLCFFLPERVFYALGIEIRVFFEPLARFIGSKEELHILVYNFDVRTRNAGMFWEPGAFAGYLMLAIIFLGLEKDKFETRWFWIRFVILLVALLTTFSTTGYVVLPFALLLYFRLNRQAKVVSVRNFLVFFLSVLSIQYMAYESNVFNLASMQKHGKYRDVYLSNTDKDFIFQKTLKQFKNAVYKGPGRYRNRFDDLVCDLDYIRRRPLLGWGLNRKTRYMLHAGVGYGSGHGEGLTDFTTKFGFVGLGIFLLCVLRSFMESTGHRLAISIFAMLLVLLILNGESFLSLPLFMGLMFIGEGSRSITGGNG